jgi:sulfane dehydrogenase subunit SoxC
MTLPGAGLHQISGLAWSGNGTIRRVEVSTDGGKAWTTAPLVAPVLPRALTRFRLPWKWDGAAAVLKSRATDDTGAVQPERDKFIAAHGHNAIFHFHGIQAWSVGTNGEVKHVYA